MGTWKLFLGLVLFSLALLAGAQDATTGDVSPASQCDAEEHGALKQELDGLKDKWQKDVETLALTTKDLTEARETIKDLQRGVQRARNDANTADSLLKNSELDKTVALETVSKYKETMQKMGKDMEALKTQLQLAQQKLVSATPEKKTVCPACPTCPKPVKCDATSQSSSEAGAATGDSCTLPKCASLAAAEAQTLAKTAYVFVTETVPPACIATWETTTKLWNQTSSTLVQPAFDEHVKPHYDKHVAPHVENLLSRCTDLYNAHLKDFVYSTVLPAADWLLDQCHVVAFYLFNWIDLEDVPLYLWLGSVKAVGFCQQGLQVAVERIVAIDSRLGAVAPVLVHGSVLVVLFLLRRFILGAVAFVVFIILSPILALVWLCTLPFRSWGGSKKKGAQKKKDKGGVQQPAATNHPLQTGTRGGALKNPAPLPFPPVATSQSAEYQYAEPLSTQASLAALRRFEQQAAEEEL